jgi:hypothetical protein
VTILLDVEIALRFVVARPDWTFFFASGRNTFDLFIAVVTTALLVPVVQSTAVYPWLSIAILSRWYRVILAIPPLRPFIVSDHKAAKRSLFAYGWIC